MRLISKFSEPFLEKKIHKYVDLLIQSKSTGNYGKFTKLAEKKVILISNSISKIIKE